MKERTVLSVNEFNNLADSVLKENISETWIRGEVSGLFKSKLGHIYFTLKDSYAEIRCVLFRLNLNSSEANFKDGDQIDIFGKPKIYSAKGTFQIDVKDVRISGAGDLFLKYEKLKIKLRDEGLFDQNTKSKLPINPRTVGVLTSVGGAVLYDVLKTFRNRMPNINIIIYPTTVQGQNAHENINLMLDLISKRSEIDILIICRGGGSIEDLWTFNNESLVRKIFHFPIPTVSAIGHETDFTLVDFVADVRAATPTAACIVCVNDKIDLLKDLLNQSNLLKHSILKKIKNDIQSVDLLSKSLVHPRDIIKLQKEVFKNLKFKLVKSLYFFLESKLKKVDLLFQIFNLNLYNSEKNRYEIDSFKKRLWIAFNDLYKKEKNRITIKEEKLRQINPKKILQRGYSIVTDSSNHVLKSNSKIKEEDVVRILFNTGSSKAKILKNNKN